MISSKEEKKIVIAVSGTFCSGKGLVARILKSMDCDIDTFSSVLKEDMRSRRMEINRHNLQNEGNRLREEFGAQVLSERLLAKYKDSKKPLVIDGLRNVGELEYLKKHTHCFLIGVDAPLEFRWQLTQKRKSEKDMIDYDAFAALDARDKGYGEPLNGQQVGMCLTHADFLIYNDEEFVKLEDSKFYKQVLDIYREIMKK
jgi:dephospho-CoA kinase